MIHMIIYDLCPHTPMVRRMQCVPFLVGWCVSEQWHLRTAPAQVLGAKSLRRIPESARTSLPQFKLQFHLELVGCAAEVRMAPGIFSSTSMIDTRPQRALHRWVLNCKVSCHMLFLLHRFWPWAVAWVSAKNLQDVNFLMDAI